MDASRSCLEFHGTSICTFITLSKEWNLTTTPSANPHCQCSCRAFFRRAHNKSGGSSDPPSYICKHDGKCDITSKNRKKCQRCRYDKCIEIGMNPNLVLTDDQKKVRFRKMFEKKGSGAGGEGNGGPKPLPAMQTSSSTAARDEWILRVSRRSLLLFQD